MNQNLKLFTLFAKVGTFTLGGGYAMLPLIEREIVDSNHLLNREEYLDIVAVAQAAPGVMAVNLSIFAGYKIGGMKGCLSAVAGTVLPSFLIILLIATIFTNFKDNPVVVSIFKGIRPVVVALVLMPVFTTAQKVGVNWKNVAVPIVTALLIWWLGVSPVLVVVVGILSAIIIIWLKIRGCKMGDENETGNKEEEEGGV